MSIALYAYLAGCIDCDGCIRVKKVTYRMRTRTDNVRNPIYSENVFLRQVTPEIPCLLQDNFGGDLGIQKSSAKKGKPLFSWAVTDKQAAHCVEVLMPYLLVKKSQAEKLLALRETKNVKYRRLAYWFEKENPDWREMELVSIQEASHLTGIRPEMISQSCAIGKLLSFGTRSQRRIPKKLLLDFLEIGQSRPRQLMNWRETIFQEVKRLNRVGV